MPGDALSADEVIEVLGLQPHPTCGYVAETYRSSRQIHAGGLGAPFADGRPAGSALYFLVTPERNVRLHRIQNDQLYHRYLGDALEVLALYPDGSHAVEVVGDDLRAGERVQLFLPGGTFHTAITEWPGVEPADVELGDPEELAGAFPAAAPLIREFTST